jgi:uncharacterized Tic20 family protein
MAETSSNNAPSQAETTQDDRTMAVLAHALQVVGGWIAPLVIFFVKRQSRFVAFHSLQALFFQLAYLVVSGCMMVFWIGGILLTVFATHGSNNHTLPPEVFLVFPLFWLGFMGLWVGTIVIAVIYSIKAGRGEWAEYPVLGGWARRVLKIGPGGEPIA